MKEGDIVAVLTAKGELVALGRALMSAESMIELKKGFVVDVERVIMDRGVYPSVWKSSQ
ncbi:MAG: hypothetical protein N3D09_05010 [Archaeoglobaceae archaeon]|nr:hypothetical protein [Archaeoglobaceae archaeon]